MLPYPLLGGIMSVKQKFDEEETKYLNRVNSEIDKKIEELSKRLHGRKQELTDHKHYIWDNIYEMDMAEKAANVNSLVGQEANISQIEFERNSLLRLRKSPYFGRIDFLYEGDPVDLIEKFYIGIRGFSCDKTIEQLVYDWRAPVSSMFYDCEEGDASYVAPQGVFKGKIRKKRQYKIENGEFVFILESSLKIDDEILQEVLSQSTDNKMKNIVSTIQREQNQIIRNTAANFLIIQGVAGSGKTSIALHRIAYLLYVYRDQIKSNQMLVISPNHVFSDYISNVLPELGETNLTEMTLDDVLRVELKNICNVEGRFESIEEEIIDSVNFKERKEGIEYKSSREFYDYMNEFLGQFIERYIVFKDFKMGEIVITKEFLKESYSGRYIGKLPYFKRFKEIAEKVAEDIEDRTGKAVSLGTVSKLEKELKTQCLTQNSVYVIYSDFLSYVSKKTGRILSAGNKKSLYYEDAFPLLYFKLELMGYTVFHRIKHVVIDEMQDYTQVQFEILKHIFPCKMTFLGDINQIFSYGNRSAIDVLKQVFSSAQIIEINKTYRSTIEITEFANKIIHLEGVDAFERHGTAPSVQKCQNESDEVKKMSEDIEALINDGMKHIAIICKSEKEAKNMHAKITKASNRDIKLYTKESVKFEGDVIILASYLAKGLEFDAVLIPNVDKNNYSSDLEKQILYIASTRALHRLCLYYIKDKTKLLSFYRETHVKK